MSSINISAGYEAVLFTGEDFNGASIVLTSSNMNLHAGGMNWGNRVGSIIVQRIRSTGNNPNAIYPPPPPVRPQPSGNGSDRVVAYVDAFYRGASINLAIGNYRSHELPGVGPRTISSIKIPPGFKVTVYDGNMFNGDYRVLTYSIENFVTEGRGLWNDRISSIRVERM
jgi:hypothetical protein